MKKNQKRHPGNVIFVPRTAEPKRYVSLIKGAAKLFDFGSTFEHHTEVLSEDSNGLREDWYLVGADLYNALAAYDRSRNK